MSKKNDEKERMLMRCNMTPREQADKILVKLVKFAAYITVSLSGCVKIVETFTCIT